MLQKTMEEGGRTSMSHLTCAMSTMLFSVVNENITQIVRDIRSSLAGRGDGGPSLREVFVWVDCGVCPMTCTVALSSDWREWRRVDARSSLPMSLQRIFEYNRAHRPAVAEQRKQLLDDEYKALQGNAADGGERRIVIAAGSFSEARAASLPKMTFPMTFATRSLAGASLVDAVEEHLRGMAL